MPLGAGMSCVKYLLFCFNLLFAITGLTIVIVGAVEESKTVSYINIFDSSFYSSAPVVLIIVGLIIFIVAFFGCCGAVKENHCMIVTFSVFLLIIFIAEVAVGIAGYMNRGDVGTSVENYLNSTISKYHNDTEVRHMYDIIQTDFHCCGIHGPEDWAGDIPNTCCKDLELTDNVVSECTPQSPSFHKDGCLQYLLQHFHSFALIVGGVGFGIAIVQLLGVIFACCLARSIRREYETV